MVGLWTIRLLVQVHTHWLQSWEFEDLEKDSVGSWFWTMSADSWVVCHWVRQLKLGPDNDGEKFSSDHDVEKLGSDHDGEKLGSDNYVEIWGSTNWDWTRGCAGRYGVVNIVWYERLLRIVSLLEWKKRSQKLINSSNFNTRVRLCICIVWFAYAYA